MHADDEWLFQDPAGYNIVSLSIGDKRDFQVQDVGKEQSLVATTLRTGDVVLMAGQMQKHYLHGVQVAHSNGQYGRFNLTWRNHLNHDSSCPLSRY